MPQARSRNRRGRPPAGLRNIDMSDHELLIVVARVADREGVASSLDVADRLGVPAKNGRSPAGRVSSRLAWMARPDYGQLERLDPREWGRKSTEAIWRLTKLGNQIVEGTLDPRVQAAVIAAGPGGSLLIMRELATRAYVKAAPGVATAIRREWLNKAAQRSR